MDDLTARSGVSRAAISKIERGERSTRLGNVVRLADAFDVRPGDLLDCPARPVGICYDDKPAPLEATATTASIVAAIDPVTGVELLRYHLPSYDTPAVLARLDSGARRGVFLLTGEVAAGRGREMVELTCGEITTVPGVAEQPLYNVGAGRAEILVIISRQ